MGNTIACQGPCFVAFARSPAKTRAEQREHAGTACMISQESSCGACETPTAAMMEAVESSEGELQRVLALRRAQTTHENDPSSAIPAGDDYPRSEVELSANDDGASTETHHSVRPLTTMRSALITEDSNHFTRIHSRSALVVDDTHLHEDFDGMDSDLQHSREGCGSVSETHCMGPFANMRSALVLDRGENCSRKNMRSALLNDSNVLGAADPEHIARKNMRSAMVDDSNVLAELESNDSNEKEEVQQTPKRRFDFGVGITRCRHCKPIPRLNRGCQLCGARLCMSCFQEHTCDNFAQLPDSMFVHDRRGHRASGVAEDVAAQALFNVI